MDIRFEWDSDKAETNVRKHGVSFETAAETFLDPLALSEQDRVEDGEYRWRTLGWRLRVAGCRAHGSRRRRRRGHPDYLGPARDKAGKEAI